MSNEQKSEAGPPVVATYQRRRLPDERPSVTYNLEMARYKGTIVVGLYPDTKQPGEIFVYLPGTLGALLDAWATMFSVALQSGVPLAVLCEKGEGHSFEPAGWCADERIGYAKSLIDYICRWLQLRFLPPADAQ